MKLICQLTKEDSKTIQKDYPKMQNLMTSVVKYDLKPTEKMKLKKLIKWYDKIPQLVARNVEQTKTELARIDATNMSSTSSSNEALERMIAKANQDMDGTPKPSIKLQMIFQDAEFVVGGESETGRAAMSINVTKQTSNLPPNGPRPIHVICQRQKSLKDLMRATPSR